MDPFQDPAKEQQLQLDQISAVQGRRSSRKIWAEGIRGKGRRNMWVSRTKSRSLSFWKALVVSCRRGDKGEDVSLTTAQGS